MLDKYYEEELRYLYESGKEFAKAHPDRAAYLNIDAVGDRDPYVERLFEGFAFLTAGIREKLDDSFPELTEGLLRLTAPHLISEIPSCVIAAFQPRSGMLPTTRVLPRGTEALSKAWGGEHPSPPRRRRPGDRAGVRHRRQRLWLRAGLYPDPLRDTDTQLR